MYYFQTAIKDTTIYQQQPTSNTGLDEVLEISKTYYGDLEDVSRPLLQFDVASISASIQSGDIIMTSAELILKECESKEIPTDYTVYAYPVSQSWDMGIGTRFDDISTEGATWTWTNSSGSDWVNVGGDFLTSVSGSETLQYLGGDLNIDIKDIMNQWLDETNENFGFILKYSNTWENDAYDYGVLQYFSKETNTIYQPKLRIGWDDQVFNTGTLTPLSADDVTITYKQLKSTYTIGSTVKIKVIGRERFPLKTYTNQYGYNDIQYLSIDSFYQIKDAITDDIIIPFSDYSKISCNPSGSFFNINFIGWEVNRDYYIEIKTKVDGSDYYHSDNNLTFNIES